MPGLLKISRPSVAAWIFTAVNSLHSPKPKAEDFPFRAKSSDRHTLIIPSSPWQTAEQIWPGPAQKCSSWQASVQAE